MKLAKLLSGVVATSAMTMGWAHAAPLFNYDQGQGLNPGGTVVFDGTRLVGANIGFDLMNASGTASDGVFHCSDAGGSVSLGRSRCLLSFTTGDLVSVTPTGPNTNIYIFGPGGSITLTGYLSTATPGNTAPVIGTTPLVVSGSFDSYSLSLRAPPSGIGGTGVGAGLGVDIKDPMMLEYFGVVADKLFRFTTRRFPEHRDGAGNAHVAGARAAGHRPAEAAHQLVPPRRSRQADDQGGPAGMRGLVVFGGTFDGTAWNQPCVVPEPGGTPLT